MAEPVVFTEDEIVAHLAGSSLFALLELAAQHRLAPLFRPVQYAAMQTIAHQGDTASTLWLIVSGQVGLEQSDRAGSTRITQVLDYGDAIGHEGVFAGLPEEATAITMAPTTLLYANAEPLWAALRADPVALDHLVLPGAVRARMAQPASGEQVTGEPTVALRRRHWVFLARGLVIPLLILVVAVPAMFLLAPVLASTPAILCLAVLGLGLPLAGVCWAFLDWRMDYLRVTNRRVIHVDKMPLISIRRREVPLGRVQDIRVASPNLMARLLGYGVLTIQTAGTRGDLTFRPVREPEELREIIMAQVTEAQAHGQRERQAQIAAHIRRSLGLVGPETLAPQSLPGAELASVDELTPGPLARLVPVLTYLLPRMRHEVGAVVTWRKHWWVLVRNAALWWLAALALATLFVASVSGAVPVAWWFGVPFWAVVLGGLWWTYENWRNDYYQLTDSHVIDVEALPLGFFRERRQTGLGQVQDIRYEVPNPIAMLLNYGSVLVETAAETGSFTFDYVHDPAGVQREIFARIDRHRARAQEEIEARQSDEFARWIQQYHEISGGAPPSPSP